MSVDPSRSPGLGCNGAMVVISRAQLRISHDTVVGFLRGAGCAIGRVHVRLSDASGVAIEEKSWFNESTDAASLPQRSPTILRAAQASGLTWKRSLPLRDSTIRAAGCLSERAKNPSNARKNSQTPPAGLRRPRSPPMTILYSRLSLC